jgi:Ca2+/H+ antiporter
MENATSVAVWLSIISFCIYVIQVFITIWQQKKHIDVAKKAGEVSIQSTPSVADLTGLIEAMSKFTDSLSKVGPALISLVASILFLVVAVASNSPLVKLTATPPQKQADNPH